MVVVGLTGGVASGKSFVAGCFEKLGAVLINADRVAHEVLQDSEVISKIVDCWGQAVLSDEGQIVRKRLGEIVFGSPGDEELDRLESITHPKIRIRIQNEMEQLRSSGKTEFLVLDIPLLFEGEYDHQCDYVIFVDATRHVREQRAKLRGWDDGELYRRESRQLPVEEKKLRSDLVIDNSGSRNSTARQLAQFMEGLGREVPKSFRVLYPNSSNDKESEFKPDPPNGHR